MMLLTPALSSYEREEGKEFYETITQGSSFLATAGLISVAHSAHFEFAAIRAIRVKVFYFQ